MSESKEIMTMRAMAWRRAKGELEAYLETFWGDGLPAHMSKDDSFEQASRRIAAFIKDFEGNCL